MPGTSTQPRSHSATAPGRLGNRIGRVLMALMAVTTLLVFVNGILQLGDTPDDRLIVEGWRTFGFGVFAGLWAILARWPRRTPGLWELLIFHKIAVTALGFTFRDAAEAQQVAVVDLTLVLLTSVAYLLCRGWQSWRGSEREHVG